MSTLCVPASMNKNELMNERRLLWAAAPSCYLHTTYTGEPFGRDPGTPSSGSLDRNEWVLDCPIANEPSTRDDRGDVSFEWVEKTLLRFYVEPRYRIGSGGLITTAISLLIFVSAAAFRKATDRERGAPESETIGQFISIRLR